MANITKAEEKRLQHKQSKTLDAVFADYGIETEDMLTDEQKKMLADSEQPFWIDGCSLEFGEYTNDDNPEGKYWALLIRVGNDRRRLNMGWNEKTDQKYSAIATAAEDEDTSVGPVRLRHVQRVRKPSFYMLEPAPNAIPASQSELTF